MKLMSAVSSHVLHLPAETVWASEELENKQPSVHPAQPWGGGGGLTSDPMGLRRPHLGVGLEGSASTASLLRASSPHNLAGKKQFV